MADDFSQRSDRPHDPDERYGARPGVTAVKRHPLDTEANNELLMQLETWWIEARDKHMVNRAERMLDHDYYDHDQISPEDRLVYESRNQAPVVLNLVHGAIDWLSGTERRTRVDWKILPRGPEDEEGAKAQTQLLKYVSDANRMGWERSRAFKDAVISGVGFVEEYLRRDRSQEPIGCGYVDWRYLWWDPFSRDLDFGDARYFHRVKFADLDRAIAMFPERAGDLRAVAVNTIDSDFELMDELDGLPAMFTLSGNGMGRTSMTRAGSLVDKYARQRVRLIETWFPKVVTTKKIKAEIARCCDLHGELYDASNPEHAEALEKEHISLTDALTTKMHMAIWVPGGGLCVLQESPYTHNLFPFTATWCYRHHRDGMPYGYVRGMRDAQDEYNKRRAKALFAASVNQVFYEAGAFDEDDEEENLEQISMPNGEVRLADGGLKKIEVKNNIDVSKQHVDFQAEAKEHIYEGNGITRENLGQVTNAISGKAIIAKQQQGAVTTAEVFDLYRYAQEISGQKTLENMKHAMALPRKIRILGGNEGLEWLAINQPVYDHTTGQVVWKNDVLNTLSDFKVAEQDYHETIRMAMAESLFETISRMPPELAIQLIDLAIDLTDLPNKDEFVARVRKINGTTPQPTTPEQLAQAEAQAEAAQLEGEERRAKIEDTRASAEKKRADARKSVIEGRTGALNAAGMVQAAMPVAMAADELYAGATATPPNPVPAGPELDRDAEEGLHGALRIRGHENQAARGGGAALPAGAHAGRDRGDPGPAAHGRDAGDPRRPGARRLPRAPGDRRGPRSHRHQRG